MSYLGRVRACNAWDPGHFRPFRADGQTVGMLRHGFAERLRRWADLFEVSQEQVALSPRVEGFDGRSAALRRVVEDLVAEGSVSHIHGEPYPVTPYARDEALCVIDRAAAPYFGVRAFGQHLNGFVRDGGALKMWIGRRSIHRRHFPGKLDNLVAGGLPHGITLGENLAKECWEEASIPPRLVGCARPVGALTYVRETAKGLKPDTLYCYDLELSADFVPRCSDGEVEEFYLWPIEQVARVVRDTEEFKLNCNLVVIDFLVRHGVIPPEQDDYLELVQGLHPVLDLADRSPGGTRR